MLLLPGAPGQVRHCSCDKVAVLRDTIGVTPHGALEVAEAQVAALAEQASDLARSVVVIDDVSARSPSAAVANAVSQAA
jgi:hypothetical protein